MHKRILRLLELIHARHTWHSTLHTLHTWISLRAMVNPMAFFMALSASVSLWRNCLLVWWTLLVHTRLEPLTSLVELIKILSLAKVLMLLLTAHLITWSSHLWLYIIICRFTIDPFVINIMASISVRIDWKKSELVLLGFLFIFELHLDKAETSASLSGSISHDNGICNNPILFEISD